MPGMPVLDVPVPDMFPAPEPAQPAPEPAPPAPCAKLAVGIINMAAAVTAATNFIKILPFAVRASVQCAIAQQKAAKRV